MPGWWSAALLAVALLGCGEQDPPLKTPTGPVTVVRSVPWELVRTDGRHLVLSYTAGTCGQADEPPRVVAVAREAEKSVTVEVRTRVVGANPCAGLALDGRVRVELDQPLSGRDLRHAPVPPSQRGLGRVAP